MTVCAKNIYNGTHIGQICVLAICCILVVIDKSSVHLLQ